MRTAGIDLSTRPRKTAVAVVEWGQSSAEVVDLSVGSHDVPALCRVIEAVDKTGIDCPFGWPTDFVEIVSAHRAGVPVRVPDDSAGRTAISLRATDHFVKDETTVRPLAVAADRIGATAVLCAGILARLQQSGIEVDRSGATGRVVEVYPAAALSQWGFKHTGYKEPKNADTCSALVDAIQKQFGWLDFGSHADLCRTSDDALDAVLCAVIARLQVTGRVLDLPSEHTGVAAVEGWIAVPDGRLTSFPS